MLVKCEICGKEKNIYPSYFKRTKKHFCSVECRLKYQSENPPKNKEKPKKEVKCKNCETIMILTQSSNIKFCSRKCYYESRKLLTD